MYVAVHHMSLTPVPARLFDWFQKEFDCWLSFSRKINRKKRYPVEVYTQHYGLPNETNATLSPKQQVSTTYGIPGAA